MPFPSSVLINECQNFYGNNDAKYTLIEFMDYECPPCKKYAPLIKSFLISYEASLRFGIFHYPLNMHRYALDAARIAQASNRQGKFWQMHERLIGASAVLDKSYLDMLSSEVGLDSDRLKMDMSVAEKEVIQHIKLAERLKVNSTPTLFLCVPDGRVVAIDNLSNLSYFIERNFGQS
jgi:protein-disulfide isomerase